MPIGAPDYVAFATDVAREAGALLMRHYRHVGVEYKGAFDTVTVADRDSERLVVDRIRARFPEHSVVAEEGRSFDGSGDFTWYVDPLDGTTNFAHGLPRFCVSIGLWSRSQGLVGVVLDPFRGDVFAAEHGSGAYLNSRRVRVSEVRELKDGLFATGFPSSIRSTNPNLYYYHEVARCTHGVRRTGSAALDLCSVAQGHFEGFWELGLKAWDVGAGLVVLSEAGGEFCSFDGGRFLPGDPRFVATNGKVTTELLRLLGDVSSGHRRTPIPTPSEMP